jgi:hypothetical protein
MATFPSYACVMLEGYEEKASYNVIRTQMDSGLAKQRARNSLPIVSRNVRIRVPNKTDKASFDTWVKVDLNGGVGWFTYTDPVDNVSKQARFTSGELSWSSPGVIWIAAAQMETLG